MAEAKPIDTGVKAADADADAAAADMKKEVKWMVVYTNYGYGEVDLVEFKKSI
jgi:hypothetical protein